MRPGIISSWILQGRKTRFCDYYVLLKLQNCEGRIISSWLTFGLWKNVSMLLWAGRSWGERRHASGFVQTSGRFLTLPQPLTWTQTHKLVMKNIINMSKKKSTSLWQHYVFWPLFKGMKQGDRLGTKIPHCPIIPCIWWKNCHAPCPFIFIQEITTIRLDFAPSSLNHQRKTGLLFPRKLVFAWVRHWLHLKICAGRIKLASSAK